MNLVCMANKQNKRGVLLLFAFLTPTLVFLLMHILAKEVARWLQVCWFACVCVLAWYLLRHQLCTFIYSIDTYDEEEGAYLFLYSVQGKRKSLLLRLPLARLCTADELTHETRKRVSREKKHCNACYNLLPDAFLRLRFADGAGYMTVDLEADEAMTTFLKQYLTERENV